MNSVYCHPNIPPYSLLNFRINSESNFILNFPTTAQGHLIASPALRTVRIHSQFLNMCCGCAPNSLSANSDYNIKLESMSIFLRKRRYSQISYEKRIRLIEMIENQGITIPRASKKLHIKLPTAKVILSNYRKKGEILDKRSTRKQDHLPAGSSEAMPAPAQPEVCQKVPEIAPTEPLCPYFYLYFANYGLYGLPLAM